MITVIREYFNRHAYIILWVVVGAFVIGLLPVAMKNISEGDKWALRVNGNEVGISEFVMESEKQRERILALREQYGEYAEWILSMLGQSDPKYSAAKALMQKELVNQFAHSIGLQVSAEALSERMESPEFIMQELSDVIPPYIVDPMGGIQQNRLRQHLKRFGMSIDTFENQIERSLLDKLMLELIASTVYVPSFDIKQRYQADRAKKKFSILTVSLKDLVAQEKEHDVSDDALSLFFNEQNSSAKRYWVPEKRSGKEWSFSPDSLDISISDEQIKEHYEKNKLKNYIDTPTKVQVRRIFIVVPNESERATIRAKAAQIKDEIMRDPSQFKSVAQRISDDKKSAENGGLLEPFARGTHEPSFDKAAFLLQKDGAVSDVIETENGFEILQRVKKIPQRFKSLASVRNDIEKTLKERAFANQFAQKIQKVLNDQASFIQFARSKQSAPKELKRVTRDQSQHLFNLEKGKRTFFVDGNTAKVIQLDAVHETYLPSLETVKKTVLEDYYNEQAKKRLSDRIKQARKELAAPALDARRGLKSAVTQTDSIDPKDEKEVQNLNEKGLPAERMLQMEKEGALITHQDDSGGSIIRLDEIEAFNPKKFDQERSEIARSLRDERMRQYLEGFVASLHRNAKIETNESVITLQ